METLAVSTPTLPSGMNAFAADAALAGGLLSDATLAGTSGRSFMELLAQQATLQLPQDSAAAKPVLEDAERQASDAGEVSPELALLGLPLQPVDVAAVLAASIHSVAPLAANVPPSVAGKIDRPQPSVSEIVPSRTDVVGGKVLPMPDAKTTDIAAPAMDVQRQQTAGAVPFGNLPTDYSSGQEFGGVLADRKLTAFNQESVPSQAAPAPFSQAPSMMLPVANVAVAGKAEMTVPQKVGSENWGSGLGDKVVWVVGNQTRGAEIHLNPPALGPLEVRVSVADGQANLSFMTQHGSVCDAIEAATPRLKEMLGDAGISMGSVSVNVGSFAQQQQSTSREPNQGGMAWSLGTGIVADASGEELISTFSQPVSGRGMVDLFA